MKLKVFIHMYQRNFQEGLLCDCTFPLIHWSSYMCVCHWLSEISGLIPTNHTHLVHTLHSSRSAGTFPKDASQVSSVEMQKPYSGWVAMWWNTGKLASKTDRLADAQSKPMTDKMRGTQSCNLCSLWHTWSLVVTVTKNHNQKFIVLDNIEATPTPLKMVTLFFLACCYMECLKQVWNISFVNATPLFCDWAVPCTTLLVVARKCYGI